MLIVCRTMTSANRLLDVVDVFAGDHRVELAFAVDHGSKFSHSAESRVRAAGYLPVDRPDTTGFDLVLTASDKTDLAAFDAPVVLLAHGAGYHRHTGPDHAVSGLNAPAMRDDHRFPTIVGLAHPDQREPLAEVSPRAARRARVIGDPCLDRLLAGEHRRAAYRAAFGATDRKLVVVNSTWGPNSLYGTDPQLPARLVAELPVDRYRVALVLHPNVFAWHGAGQVHAWLAEAREAGLVVLPPDEGWRAALIAADAVLSDHGSVTCYAAALGRPVALAADGGDEVVAGSPMDVLRKNLPQLGRRDLLVPQVESLLATHRPSVVRSLTTTIFDRHAQAMTRLRELVYGELGLALPDNDSSARAVPVPRPCLPEVDAHAVQATVHGDHVHLDRFAAVLHDRWLDPPQPRFVALHADEPDLRLRESASVVLSRAPKGVDGFPGATTAYRTAAGLVVTTSAGPVTVTGDGVDDLALASAVHAIVRSGSALRPGQRLTITAGHSAEVVITQ